jgi:murein DD-endopeptidase MepM/ murein hydrolase activator NlpD
VPAQRSARLLTEPLFVESHQLAAGETLGQVAASYGVNPASLFWANNLEQSRVLAAGRELRIPRTSGVLYTVQPGETVEAIARRFGVDPAAIVLFGPNRLDQQAPGPAPGRELFIPGAEQPYPPDVLARFGSPDRVAAMVAVAAATVRESETNLRDGPDRAYARVGQLDAGVELELIARHREWLKVVADGTSGWVRRDLLLLPEGTFEQLVETNDFPPPPPVWVWPTNGALTSSFGWRTDPYRSFHNGLDIANAAWTKIRAARAGTVTEAGWCRGYGYCVRINHGEGIVTIYGHLIARPPVRVGDRVAAGDVIGAMGSTYDASGGGYSTGVHLHFTITVYGKPVDPMRFLP